MEITIEDVRQLALELWMAQREIQMLRAETTELRHLLGQATAQPAPPEGG